MSDFYNRVGTNEIYTSSYDLVTTVTDEKFIDDILTGLNGAVTQDEYDELEEKNAELEESLKEANEALAEAKEELRTYRENFKFLTDNDVFDIDHQLDKFEGIEDNMPQEFFTKLKKLTERIHSVDVENFGEPQLSVRPTSSLRGKKSGNGKSR